MFPSRYGLTTDTPLADTLVSTGHGILGNTDLHNFNKSEFLYVLS